MTQAVLEAREARFPTIFAGALGNMIEWYDWTIYGLFAGAFSKEIFPAEDQTTSVIAVLITFAVGFLMRPVGSIVLSPLGDRHGRRRLLALTIILMGIGSLMVALTPTYATIGIASPIILLAARLLQGFSAGGEFQGSTVYLVEHAPPDHRAFHGSVQLVSIGLAILLANGVSVLTTRLVPAPEFSDWGWRLPFLIGALMSFYGLYIRWRLPETPAFAAAERRQEIVRNPMVSALREHPRETLYVFAIQATTVMFYLWTVFLPTYANLVGGLPLPRGLLGGTIALAVFCVAVPLWALVSDKIGRKPVLIGAAVGFFILAYPMFGALGTGDFSTFLAVDIAGCTLIAMIDGVMSAVFCELFPTRVRTSGIGIPYAICSALLGGTTPLLAAWFIRLGQPLWIAYYVMAIALAAGAVFTRMPETRGRSLG
jgi:MHS family alpha-ketoglutarate permease-like MFS transporter